MRLLSSVNIRHVAWFFVCSFFAVPLVSLLASPKVSVIIPVYNAEKFLCECVDSVLSQSFADFELVCIDDGSTDRSMLMLEEYAKKDTRVRVIRQKNSGAATARNNGMKHAAGEYILFVDSDDVAHKDMLKILMDIMEKHSCDMVMCNFTRDTLCDDYGDYQKKTEIFLKYPEKPLIDCRCQVCWNKLYRKASISDIKFRDGMRFSEDMYFNLLVFAKIKKYAHVSVKLYKYRDHAASIMSTIKGFSIKNIDDFVFAIRGIHEKTPPSRVSSHEFQQNIINSLALYLLYSTSSIKESLYAAEKVRDMYCDGIVNTDMDFFGSKCCIILIIAVGKISNLIKGILA